MIQVKIPRALFQRMQSDLSRPHRDAAERVGFLFARLGTVKGGGLLILATDYMPTPDHQYILDPTVGARISGEAIRTAMQRVLDRGEGAFHVHRHDHKGRPWFSRVDLSTLGNLVPPFQNVGSTAAHGALLLSLTEAVALVWPPGHREPTGVTRVSLIGEPMQFFGRC